VAGVLSQEVPSLFFANGVDVHAWRDSVCRVRGVHAAQAPRLADRFRPQVLVHRVLSKCVPATRPPSCATAGLMGEWGAGGWAACVRALLGLLAGNVKRQGWWAGLTGENWAALFLSKKKYLGWAAVRIFRVVRVP